MKQTITLLILFAAATQAAYVTGLRAGFTNTANFTPGNWNYYALYNNGSYYTSMTWQQVNERWYFDSLAVGDGFILNNTATFGAGTNTLVFYPPTTIGGHPITGNLSANWTANNTGRFVMIGWHKIGFFNANQFNITVRKNTEQLYDNINPGDGTNRTFTLYIDGVNPGDNISIIGGAKTVDQSPHINLSAEIYYYGTMQPIITTPPNGYVNLSSTVLPVGFYANTTDDVIINASLFWNASGWAVTTSNSTNVLNNTLAWINKTAITSGQYIIAIQVCGKNFGCNMTENRTVTYVTPNLKIQALDEADSVNKLFSVTIANATNSTTYAATTNIWFNKTRAELPIGNLTITVTNASFYIRNYYVYFNDTDVTLTAYLLNVSNPYSHQVRFSVVDIAGGQIAGALVSVQKLIGSVYVNVSQQTTDSSGVASFYLDATTQYQIVVTKTGYTTLTTTIVPSGSDYILTLSGTGGTGFSNDYSDTSVYLVPEVLSTNLFTINATVASTDCNLAYYALRVILFNGTQLAFDNQTTACGGTLQSGVINSNGWNATNLTAVVQLKKSFADELNYSRQYQLFNFTGVDTASSLTVVFQTLATTNMSSASKGFIALGASTILATGGWLATGATGAGFLFVAGMAIFALAGWFEANLIYLLVIIVLALIVIQRF